MKSTTVLLAAMLSACAVVDALAGQGHPIGKIIELLQKCKETAIDEGKKEAAHHSQYQYDCKTGLATFDDAIKVRNGKLDILKDELSGLKTQDAALTTSMAELRGEISKKESSSHLSGEKYKQDIGKSKKDIKDLEASISVVGGVLKDMNSAQSGSVGALLLEQHVSNSLALISMDASDEQAQNLHDLQVLVADPALKAKGDKASHVAGYQFKSGTVVDLLKKLKAQFTEGRQKATMGMARQDGNYEVQNVAMKGSIAASEEQLKNTEEDHADTKNKAGEKGKDQSNLQEENKDEQRSRDQLRKDCSKEQIEWDTRSKTRALEITALDTAKEMLGKSTGVQTKAPKTVALPLPPAEAAEAKKNSESLLQTVSDPKMKAVAFLREAAAVAHEKALERLVVAVSAHMSGPMDKMTTMIQNMIWRLKKEQQSETEHKLWCDKEVEKATYLKTEHTSSRDELVLKVDAQEDRITKLTKDIQEAKANLGKYTAYEKESTAVRNTGKEENKAALKDAQDAQKAVENAMATLTSFYAKSGHIKEEALIQQPGQAAYTGTGGADGVMKLMQNVLQDFVSMESETKAQEFESANAYKKEMDDMEIEKARSSNEVKNTEALKNRAVQKKAKLMSDKRNTKEQLTAATRYLADLQPACVSGDSDYATRKGNRDKEIASLEEAKKTLAGAFSAPVASPEPAPERDSLKFMERRVSPH